MRSERSHIWGPAGISRRLSTPLGADIAVALAFFIVLFVILKLVDAANVPLPPSDAQNISTSPDSLPYYALRSLLRMFIGLGFSYVFALSFGYWAAHSKRAERILVPALDILQSVPVLGFLSITVTGFLALFPGSELGLECAAIFAIFTAQAWNLAFSMYNSCLTRPKDLDEMSGMFGLNPWLKFWRLEVPNASIGLVWNGMMSMGGAWFFLTLSETINVGNQSYALPGIGSYAEAAITDGDLGNTLWAIATMIILVVGVNILFWRPLVAWAERFRNEQSAPEVTPTSHILNLFRQARWIYALGRFRTRVSLRIARLFEVRQNVVQSRPPVSGTRKRTTDVIFWIIVGIGLAYGLWQLIAFCVEGEGISVFLQPLGLGFLTMLRVAVVLVLSTIIWVPIGVKIGMSPKASRIAQPLVQICASFPANFLFPFVVSFLLFTGISLNIGSIFLMMLGAQWYILFNVIAASQAIPGDLREAMTNIRVGGILWWKRFALPCVFPGYVTGGITASGGAWNTSIVAEIVTFGTTTLTAAGLGEYISAASSSGNTRQLLTGVIVMSIFVVTINRLLWKRLIKLAERRYSLS